MENQISSPISPPPGSFGIVNMSPKPKNRLIKIIVAIIFLFLLGTGTSLAILASRIWDPLWNPFRPNPEKVIKKMSRAMAEIKTNRFDLDSSLRIENEIPLALTLRLSGENDSINPQEPKSAGDFTVTFAIEGISVEVTGQFKGIGMDSYWKFTTIPVFDELKNQWIKSMGKEVSPARREEITEKFKELIKDKKFYFVKQEFPDEKINQITVYHYLVGLNNQEIKNLILESIKFLSQEGIIAEFPPFSKEEIEKLQGDIDKFFEKIGELSGEIWIGKKDYLLYRLKGEKTFEFEIEGQKGKLFAKVYLDFSKFNQPVEKIEVPKEYKTWEEILTLPIFELPEIEKPSQFPKELEFPLEKPSMLKDLSSYLSASLRELFFSRLR